MVAFEHHEPMVLEEEVEEADHIWNALKEVDYSEELFLNMTELVHIQSVVLQFRFGKWADYHH